MSTTAMTGTVRLTDAAVPSRRASSTLRLTRRGRLVAFLGCLVVACVGLVLLAGAAIGSAESGPPAATRVVTVQTGDTLWGIATRVAPGEDPRDVIEQIRDLNPVGSSLQAGDKIDVPLGDG